MKLRWDRLGGVLGILYCVAGLVLIFLGWNGAASYDRVAAQMPYVVSGGLAGLALCVIGAGVMITSGARTERARLQAVLEDLQDALQRTAEAAVVTGGASAARSGPRPVSGSVAPVGAEPAAEAPVLAGPNAYHRPDCRLVADQTGLTPMTAAAARARGLDPCRICAPG
jgi:hypothetical protein